MLQSIKIRNLRGLRSLDLGGFSHVNLLTGLNGAGKTTLLEAVFLNCGASNAGLATKLSLFRDDFEITPFNDLFFKGLFPYLNATEPVHIEVKGDSRKKFSRAIRSLKITARFKTIGDAPSTRETMQIDGLRFEFKGPSGKSEGNLLWEPIDRIVLPEGKTTKGARLRFLGKDPADLLSANFISPYYRGLWPQIHDQLTELVKRRRVHSVVKSLQFIIPELRDLLPLSEDRIPIIWAVLEGDYILPASLLGSGFSNALRIMLIAHYANDSILLIDEIEDGLHFSGLRDLIRFIFHISRKNNIQFFITTHSEAVLHTFSEISREDKFSQIALYRMGKREGETYCTRFSRKEFLEASDIRAEIR